MFVVYVPGLQGWSGLLILLAFDKAGTPAS